MKKVFLSLAVLAFGVMTSCVKEQFAELELQVEDKVEVSATLADVTVTRTQLDEEFKVRWSGNDAISVFSSADECHDRYYITDGVNSTSAKFQWDKSFNGTITGGIDVEGSENSFYVGVYPFNEGASVKFANDTYVINTVIPTTQNYAVKSFGQGASVMVGVDMVNPKPNFSFRNVGTVLKFPIKGEGTIKQVTLSSTDSKIAGNAVITVSAENDFVPTTNVSNGESVITLSCGEGVELNSEDYTYFHFVLAPGTYTDLAVKFTDSYGNFFEQAIENPNGKAMERSKTYRMPEMTFVAQGTEELNLWIEAIAPVTAVAERVVPSVDDINVVEWVKNLANQDRDFAVLIGEVLAQVKLGDYKQVFNILGGIPGFVKETRTFEATGYDKQPLQYTYTHYIESLLGEITAIDSADEFVAYVNKLSIKYQGFEEKLDESLGTVGSYLESLIPGYKDLTDEEKLEFRKTSLYEYIDEDINILKGITEEEFVGTATEYINTLSTLKVTIANCTNITDVDNAVKAVKLGYIRKEDGKTFLGIKKWKYLYGNVLTGGFNGDAILLLLQAQDYADKLAEELGNKSDLFESIANINISKYLMNNIENKDGIVYQTVSKLFEYPEFVESIQSTLTKIVKEYEDIENSKIDQGNVESKAEAIELTKGLVIGQAQDNAYFAINDVIEAANKSNLDNLNNGPWGIFKRVLAWDKCVSLFNEYNLIAVHTALENLCLVIEDLIQYEQVGAAKLLIATEDYVEGENYWVKTYSEEF